MKSTVVWAVARSISMEFLEPDMTAAPARSPDRSRRGSRHPGTSDEGFQPRIIGMHDCFPSSTPFRVEVLLQALPAAKILVLKLGRFYCKARRLDHRAGFEH